MADPDPLSPLAGTEVHLLRSEHVGDVFKIFVGHCDGPGGAGQRDVGPVAVLYITDANGLFGGAVDLVRLMQLSAHLPPLLIVGIGYPVGGIDETIVQRTRDLTPTSDPDYARIVSFDGTMGGAPGLLAFIRDELQPWVRSRFDVSDESMYFGHSLGGLFGTYVLLTEPATFGRYGIGSPSLWWHGDMMFGVEAAYAAEHDDLAARVLFGVGEHEDHDGRQREASPLPADVAAIAGARYIDMRADTIRMATALQARSYPSLEVDHVVLDDEFHITVALVNLSRSLRRLFDAPR